MTKATYQVDHQTSDRQAVPGVTSRFAQNCTGRRRAWLSVMSDLCLIRAPSNLGGSCRVPGWWMWVVPLEGIWCDG